MAAAGTEQVDFVIYNFHMHLLMVAEGEPVLTLRFSIGSLRSRSPGGPEDSWRETTIEALISITHDCWCIDCWGSTVGQQILLGFRLEYLHTR